MELIPLLMFVAVGVTLLSGYPVAFCLGGVALIFAAGGLLGGSLRTTALTFLPGRRSGSIEHTSLMAVPPCGLMAHVPANARVAAGARVGGGATRAGRGGGGGRRRRCG
mgnify:CR=1 FL=1